MPNTSKLNQVKEHLASGETEAAADLLLLLTKNIDEVYYGSALMIKNLLEHLQQDGIDGVLSANEQNIGRAKISRRILRLTQQIEKGEKPQKVEELLPHVQKPKPVTSFSRRLLWIVPLVLLISFLGYRFSAKTTNHYKTKEQAGKLLYSDGRLAVEVEVSIVPISEDLPDQIKKPIKFKTNNSGSFNFKYPELFEDNIQVNIFYSKNGVIIDRNLNIRFMPQKFKTLRIQS